MKLRTYLQSHQIRQDEFAARIGVTQSYVSRLVRGAQLPSRRLVRRIAEETDNKVGLHDFEESDERPAA